MAAAGLFIESAGGHDVITTKLTWSKEVSRIVYSRCLGCHREGGAAFSLAQYGEARPWAKAIQEAVLQRKMPPWDAVKGFGEFAGDRGLSQEEIQTLAAWVEGGAPEGDAALLPERPKARGPVALPKGTWMRLDPAIRLSRGMEVLAIDVRQSPLNASFKLVAETGAGDRVPLLWLEGHSARSEQQYRLSQPLRLPAGARIVSYPAVSGIQILLR